MRIASWLCLGFLLAMCWLLGGCVETGLPDLSGPRAPEYYFPKEIPANCGPRSNECAERRADGDLTGLHVERQGDEYVLLWASDPYQNDISPMQAVAHGSAKIHCAYPSEGAPEVYKSDEVTVEIEPGGARLLSGTIRVPVANVSEAARGYAAKMLFDSITIERRMEGIVFKSADLTFDYVGTKDGFASARWSAIASRITIRATARADNAAPVTLDTSTFAGKATCRIFDKDGNELKADQATPVTNERGQVEAYGVIRLPVDTWKLVDWKLATVRWEFTEPAAEKPTAMRSIRMRVAAYCPCEECCPGTNGMTAANTLANDRGAAADWRCLPAGTLIRVSGFGAAVRVDDTGAALRKAWRDRREPGLELRFPTHEQARAWGVRWMAVDILEG